MENQDEEAPSSWRAFWLFLIHTITGTLIFAIIAAAAVFLDYGVHRWVPKETNAYILYGLSIAEYSIFSVDLILFLVYLVRTARRAYKHL